MDFLLLFDLYALIVIIHTSFMSVIVTCRTVSTFSFKCDFTTSIIDVLFASLNTCRLGAEPRDSYRSCSIA